MWSTFQLAKMANNIPSVDSPHGRENIPKTKLGLEYTKLLIVKTDALAILFYTAGLLVYTFKYTFVGKIPKLDAYNKDFRCEDLAQHDCIKLLWIRFTSLWTLTMILASLMCSLMGDALKNKSVYMMVLWLILHLSAAFGIAVLLITSFALSPEPDFPMSSLLFVMVLWRIYIIYKVAKVFAEISNERKMVVVVGEFHEDFVDDAPDFEMKAITNKQLTEAGGETVV